MNITELEFLANVANNNEDLLKNKTTNLRDKVRDWCIEEMMKIEAKEKKLLDFVNKNTSLFCDKCGTPYFYSYGMCYARKYIGNLQNDVNYTKLMVNSIDNVVNGYGKIDPYWQQASVYGWTTKVQGCFDCMNGDIEYWTKMKKCIDFRWWQLEKMCEKCKKILNDNITEQKKRMNDIVNVCGEIDEARNDVEVTISVKVK